MLLAEHTEVQAGFVGVYPQCVSPLPGAIAMLEAALGPGWWSQEDACTLLTALYPVPVLPFPFIVSTASVCWP